MEEKINDYVYIYIKSFQLIAGEESRTSGIIHIEFGRHDQRSIGITRKVLATLLLLHNLISDLIEMRHLPDGDFKWITCNRSLAQI